MRGTATARAILFLVYLLANIPDINAATTATSSVGLTVLSNSATVLHCTADNNNPTSIAWTKDPDGPNPEYLVNNCAIQSGYTSMYAVAQDAPTGDCALVILQANSSMAGTYRCGDTGVPSDTNVTVLENTPSVYFDFDANVVNISCEVSYTGPITPSLIWYNVSGDNVIEPTVYQPGTNMIISMYTYELELTSNYTEIPIITCYVDPPRFSGKPYSWTSPIFAGSTANEIKMSQYWTVVMMICYLLINQIMSFQARET